MKFHEARCLVDAILPERQKRHRPKNSRGRKNFGSVRDRCRGEELVLIDSELVNRVLYPGKLSPTCVEMHWDSAVWKRPPSSTIAATSCCGASMSSKPQQLPRLDATLSRHSRDEIWGRNLEGWREIGGRAKVPVGTHPGCIWFPRDRRSRGCARSKPQSWETSCSRDLEKRALLSSEILHM